MATEFKNSLSPQPEAHPLFEVEADLMPITPAEVVAADFEESLAFFRGVRNALLITATLGAVIALAVEGVLLVVKGGR